jgi:hypothetical protein
MPKTTLRKTSKLKYFTDVNGEKVAMNSQRLSQVASVSREGTLWFTTPKEIRIAAKKFDNEGYDDNRGIRIFANHLPEGIFVSFGSPEGHTRAVRYIGCHAFYVTTFNRILRLAGVKGV